jgi:hypothetical protein
MIVEDQPDIAETTDPAGMRVILDDAIWHEKIIRDHPEIASHMEDALRAVSTPDHVAPDPSFEAARGTTRVASVQVAGCWSS